MDPDKQPWMIVIAERGWIYAGRVHRDGDLTVITSCWNVRRWGTTKGLGELALNGPQSETILDWYGTVRVHVLAVVGALDVTAGDEWQKYTDKNAPVRAAAEIPRKRKS